MVIVYNRTQQGLPFNHVIKCGRENVIPLDAAATTTMRLRKARRPHFVGQKSTVNMMPWKRIWEQVVLTSPPNHCASNGITWSRKPSAVGSTFDGVRVTFFFGVVNTESLDSEPFIADLDACTSTTGCVDNCGGLKERASEVTVFLSLTSCAATPETVVLLSLSFLHKFLVSPDRMLFKLIASATLWLSAFGLEFSFGPKNDRSNSAKSLVLSQDAVCCSRHCCLGDFSVVVIVVGWSRLAGGLVRPPSCRTSTCTWLDETCSEDARPHIVNFDDKAAALGAENVVDVTGIAMKEKKGITIKSCL